METRVHLPDMDPPSSITEVMVALRSKKLEPKHEKKSWGDWIIFPGKQTVISIESMRGLASSDNDEHAEEDEIVHDSRDVVGQHLLLVLLTPLSISTSTITVLFRDGWYG